MTTRLPICLTMRGSFIAAPATFRRSPGSRRRGGGRYAAPWFSPGPRGDRRAAIGVADRAIDGRKTIVDRAPDGDFAIRLEQGVEIVLEVGQQEGADAGGLEQPHVSGFPPGHVDVGIERDLRAPQRLIHVGAPDLALKAAVQRGGGGQRLRRVAEQLEIVTFGNGLEQRNPLPVIRRHRADKGNLDVDGGRRRQRFENGRLERQMIDFRAHAEAAEEIHRRRQLRHHQIVDRPVHAARRRNPDLSDQDRVADRLDTPHQLRVDVKRVLVEHHVGFEILDLGQQDCLGLVSRRGLRPTLRANGRSIGFNGVTARCSQAGSEVLPLGVAGPAASTAIPCSRAHAV